MAQVTLRYFAVLREQRGLEVEDMAVAEGTSVDALYRRVFPEQAAGGLRVGFAVNRQVVPADHVLVDGDELALLPPLGGG